MLSTKNLILKPVTEKDFDIYSQILSSNQLTKYLPKGKAYSKAEIKFHVDNRINHWVNGFGSYVISLKTGSLAKIGYVGIELCEDRKYSDIRYALLPNHQGNGFVQEAAHAVLNETFKANKHTKIYGVALKENIASLSIIKKLGMQPEPNVELYSSTNGLEIYSIEKFKYESCSL